MASSSSTNKIIIPKEEFPQTLQELLTTEDTVARELNDTTGTLIDLVREFEQKHSRLIQKQKQLKSQSSGLRQQINVVESAVKKLTFPSHMIGMEELLREFVDENNTDIDFSSANNESSSSSYQLPSLPSELIRFTNNKSVADENNNNNSNVGQQPITRDEQLRFSSLFADGGLLESQSTGAVGEQYFEIAGRSAPAPLPLAKSDNPDEALLDLAYVPFSVSVASTAGNTNTVSQEASSSSSSIVIRKRSPLTDIAVMRCPSLGGRVLVSKRMYKPGQLILCESPFLSIPKSITSLIPMMPPLLQRVIKEMLALPQAQEAMKRQGWDPQLANCVLVYLAQQTFDSMARKSDDSNTNNNTHKSSSSNNTKDGKENHQNNTWMWKSPAPLFRFTSGDYVGEDPAAKRRMRKMLFLGAPLQSMDTNVVHQLHKLAKFIFAALPPCYRDFEGDEQAARSAVSEWARRGLANAFDVFSDEANTKNTNDNNSSNGKNSSSSSNSNLLNQITLAPYDDNPAHRQVPVNPLGRESTVVTSDAAGKLSEQQLNSSTQHETEAALQLPPECRVSVADIVRIFAVFQTNCISLRTNQSFVSTTVSSIEIAAGHALRPNTAQLPPAANQNGLFTFMSMLEHSCCPNVAWVPASPSSSSSSSLLFGTLELRALRQIVPGERLKVSYVPPILPANQRRLRLRGNYYFSCSCEACTGIDWCRPVRTKQQKQQDDETATVAAAVVDNNNIVVVPFSTSGDWLKLDDGSIISRNSAEAAEFVRAENEFLGLISSATSTKKQRKNLLKQITAAAAEAQNSNSNNQIAKPNSEQQEEEDEEEQNDEDDDNKDEDEQFTREPFQLVLKELEKTEQVINNSNNNNNKNTKSTPTSSNSNIHPSHVASYLRAMRLCTAWSYLIIACVPNWSQHYKEKQLHLVSQRVRSCLLRFAIFYSRSLLNETEAKPIVEVLSKFVPSSSSSSSSGVNTNPTTTTTTTKTTIVPGEPRSVFIYSSLVPMIENIAVTLTLENVVLKKFAIGGDNSDNNSGGDVSDLWRVLIDLIEKRLGWERSPYASKYRLYVANPTQCLLAPTEQPL